MARKGSREGGCGTLTFDQEVRMRNGSRGSGPDYCRFLVIDQISQKKQLMGRRISFSPRYGMYAIVTGKGWEWEGLPLAAGGTSGCLLTLGQGFSTDGSQTLKG